VLVRKDNEMPNYNGTYSVLLADIYQSKKQASEHQSFTDLSGRWQVEFDPAWGGPGNVVFETLTDWKDNEQDGIKHFSGTAHYKKTFVIKPSDLKKSGPIYLDLGDVQQIAEISINGEKLATLWKPPFAINIRDAVKAGTNTLQIDVMNTWVNRLIGDEALPDTSGYKMTGDTVDWINNNEPPPESERVTFTGYNFFAKEETRILQTSGLLGPVRLVFPDADN